MESLGDNLESLQLRTLVALLALAEMEPDWSRRLVMLAASDEAAPFALAVSAAGGAVLWTSAEERALRESSQAGVIDFQVTSLSEALRVLKNEIRKGVPVSVGVLDSAGSVWDEAVERGVQPHALLERPEHGAAAHVLLQRGAVRLPVYSAFPVKDQFAGNWRERRAGDAALLAAAEQLSEPERAVATRWLRSAPRLFPRDTFRCYAAAWDASKDSR